MTEKYGFSSLAGVTDSAVGLLCRSLVFFFLLAGLSRESAGQDVLPVVIDLKTNFPESIVYADSLYLGRAENRLIEVPATTNLLWLVPPATDSWSLAPISIALSAAPGDTLDLTLNFQYHYKLESVPFSAQVFIERPYERLLLGETPLLYKSDTPLRGMLLVSKEGYEPKRFTPGEELWNHHYVELELENEQLAEEYWRPQKRSGRWIDVLVGSASLASGIVAIHFKMKADRRYDEYARSGNPALRGGFERYDRYAAISLGAMQVGLGVLAVRFVIDR